VRLFENTGTICTELVKKIDYHGYKIVEVPVHHYFRAYGNSQFFTFRRVFHVGVSLIQLWWELVLKKWFKKLYGQDSSDLLVTNNASGRAEEKDKQ